MISKNIQLNMISYDKTYVKPNDLNNNQSDKRSNFHSYYSINQLSKNKDNVSSDKIESLPNNINDFEKFVDKENKFSRNFSKVNYNFSNQNIQNENSSFINSNKKSDEINKRLQRIIDMIKEQRLRDFKKQNLRSNCYENKNSLIDFNIRYSRISKSLNEKLNVKKVNKISKCKSLNELFDLKDTKEDISLLKTKVQITSNIKNCRQSLLTSKKINKTKFVASFDKSETFDYSKKLFNHDSQLNNFLLKTNQSNFADNNKIMSVNKNGCEDFSKNDKLLDHQNEIKDNNLNEKVNKIKEASLQDLKNINNEKNQYNYDNLKTRLRLNELRNLQNCSSKLNRIPPPRSFNNLGDLCIEPGHNVVFASTNFKNHLCSVVDQNEDFDVNYVKLENKFNNQDSKYDFKITTCADKEDFRLGYENINDKLNINSSKKCSRPASSKNIICEKNSEYETGTCVQLSEKFFHQYSALENLNFTSKRTLNEISCSNNLFANEENTEKKAHAQSTSFSETRNKILTNSKKKISSFSSRSTSALDTSLLNSGKNLNEKKIYQTNSSLLKKNFDEVLNQCLIDNSKKVFKKNLIDIETKNNSMLQLSGKKNSIENDLNLSESKPNCDKFNKTEEMSLCYDQSSGTEEDFENNQLLTVSSTTTSSSTNSSYLSNKPKQSSLCINKSSNKNKSNHNILNNNKEQSITFQSQQQSPTNTSSSSFLSIPVINNIEEDSIDDGIHLNSVPETRPIRDYRSHEEFVYAMKEDLAEWLNSIYNLELNVNNFMDQIGTGVIICRHANNLIQQAKNFYIQSDVVNIFNDHSQHVNKNTSIDQRRLSNCSVVSSLSNNGSNNELSSLPVNLILYNAPKDNNSTQTRSFSNSAKTLRPSKSAQNTPHASPKHLGNLNRTNSSSTTSLSSPIKNSNKLNQNLKTNNTQTKSRNFSGSRIPQIINNSASKRLTLHNQVNIKSKNSNDSVKNKSFISSKSNYNENSNRKKTVASSASSSNLIVNSKSFYTPQLVRNSRTSLTSLNLTNCKNFSLTSNKNLSYSSSAIFNNIDKNSQSVNDFSSNFSNRLSKNSKKYVPLSKTKLLFSGSNNISKTINQKCLNVNTTNSFLSTDQNNDQQKNLAKTTIDNQKNCSGNKVSTIPKTNSSQQLSSINLSQSNWTEHQKKLRNLADAELIVYRDNVKPQSWHSRDNVSNFITACRNTFKIRDCLLFETDDLVMRKNERSFVLCMLELARIGCNFGISAPLIIQLEQEIDKEIALEEQNQANNESEVSEYQNATTSINSKDTDSAISSDCEPEEQTVEPPTQIVTNDLKSLHERVVELLSLCNCPSQYPMIKVADGKYRIGETKVLIFVRILRNHVMVRVGGGWDTLQQYLLRHDPCRCKSGHKYVNQTKIAITTNNNHNSLLNSNRKLSCDSISSLTSNYMSNGQNSINKNHVSKTKDDNLSIMVTYNRCSTNVQG